MINSVNIKLFLDNSEASIVTRQLIEELMLINNKINVTFLNFKENEQQALNYGLHGAPSFTILNSNEQFTGILYNGMPLGHEINSLLVAILNVSGYPLGIDNDIVQKILNIKSDVNIKVFVTTSCPYCSSAVITAQKMALLNLKIKAEMIDSNIFKELAVKYNVVNVPTIIINDNISFLGDQPIETLINAINKL